MKKDLTDLSSNLEIEKQTIKNEQQTLLQIQNELSKKIREADFETTRANRKYNEQIKLNSDYITLHDNYDYLQKQYTNTIKENADIKGAVGFAASTPCEQVINKISDMKESYNQANDYLNNKLRLGYQAAKAVTLIEKIEKYVLREVKSKEIVIDDKMQEIDLLKNEKNTLKNQLEEIHIGLSKLIKTIRYIILRKEKFDLPESARDVITSASEYGLEMLRNQNAYYLAAEAEASIDVDKDIIPIKINSSKKQDLTLLK